MRLVIQFNLDTAAFQDNPFEVHDILKDMAVYFNYMDGDVTVGQHLPLFDSYGNRVGDWEVVD